MDLPQSECAPVALIGGGGGGGVVPSIPATCSTWSSCKERAQQEPECQREWIQHGKGLSGSVLLQSVLASSGPLDWLPGPMIFCNAISAC